MLKQSLNQKLLQKLSPQQIQFIKLLQLNSMDFEQKTEQELLDNPALENGKEEDRKEQEDNSEDFSEEVNDVDISDYLNSDNFGGVKLNDEYNDENKDMPLAESKSFHEYLTEQATTNFSGDDDLALILYLLGGIEEDGYLRRELKAIKNDLAFTEDEIVSEEELEKALKKVQSLDPAGIAARSLQECLIIQLERLQNPTKSAELAQLILKKHMKSFTKKHYQKIMRSLKIGEDDLKEAISEITHLNPKPGQAQMSTARAEYIIPDFILHRTGDKLDIVLNSKNAPELRLSSTFSETLNTYEKSEGKEKKDMKDTVQFIKQKLDGAKWFIDSVKQRQKTLLDTMNAILREQRDFFEEGEEATLKPMILKDIAEKVHLDISTISRVANSKYIQTDFGIVPLKFFFSEGIMSDSGEEVSNREVKKILREAVDGENKSKPLTDERLMKLLKEKGYNIARRTVAKYREQLNIPVARLRKVL